MKQLNRVASTTGLLAVGLFVASGAPAHAQNNITPTAPGRFYIELRDATLADSLELIFKAAGNPSHIIDESAQKISIGNFTLTNIAWDSAVRQLANANAFRVSRNETGAYVIEPREPVAADSGAAPGGVPFGPSSSGSMGAVPANPFGGKPTSRPFTGARGLLVPQVETMSDAQTRPNLGGPRGGAAASDQKDYKIIIVRHIYAGGLAQLFQNSTVIRTEDFVSPGSGSGGSGSGRSGRAGGSVASGGGIRSVGGGGSSGGFGGSTGGGGFGGSTGGSTGGFGGGFGF